MYTYTSRDFPILHIALWILERIVQTTLGNLTERLEVGLEFLGLRVANLKNGRLGLVEWMNDISLGCGRRGPVTVDKIGDKVARSCVRAKTGGVHSGPGRKGGHGSRRPRYTAAAGQGRCTVDQGPLQK